MVRKGWKQVTLGDIALFQGGSQPPLSVFSSQKKAGYIRLVQIRDYKTDKYATYIPEKLAKRFCKQDDIMIGRYGPPIFQILRGIEGAYNVALIKALPQGVDKEFLYHTLKREDLFEYIDLLSRRTSGQTGVDLTNLKAFELSIPALTDEQATIAKALSDVDGLIYSLQKLIEKKKAIKQGATQELLTGKKRLPGFCGVWKKKCLCDLAADIKTGTKNNEDKVKGGKYPFFVRSANVEKINSYSYDCEAILVPGEGNIGEIFHYINGKFDCHQRVYKISDFRECIGLYIFYYLKMFFGAYALLNTVKATVDSLRLPTFQNFIIYVPSDLKEQQAIAQALSDMDSEIEQLEKKLAKYQQIKQGMMQELLTGRIRLA